MYKNFPVSEEGFEKLRSFNPCFNGSMYKNNRCDQRSEIYLCVSILVLMDLCIKTLSELCKGDVGKGFNPCFNGSMYKNLFSLFGLFLLSLVSILVLMDLCIKTQ